MKIIFICYMVKWNYFASRGFYFGKTIVSVLHEQASNFNRNCGKCEVIFRPWLLLSFLLTSSFPLSLTHTHIHNIFDWVGLIKSFHCMSVYYQLRIDLDQTMKCINKNIIFWEHKLMFIEIKWVSKEIVRSAYIVNARKTQKSTCLVVFIIHW